MQLRDPCKNCLVKAVCKVSCDDEQDYWNTRLRIVELTIKGSMILAVLVLLFNFVRFGYE